MNKEGNSIQIVEGKLSVPDFPIIPFIEGDGVGPEIMKAAKRIWEKGIEVAYGDQKKIVWLRCSAGEKALAEHGDPLPEETVETIRKHIVAIKSPLTTPVGGGYRSLNVTLRQTLDLYACVRPVHYFEGVPSPVVHPERMDMVIFRENTEDVYAGIEWPKGSQEVEKLISFVKKEFDISIREDSGIGIKPISERATKRLVRKALQYAIDQKRRSVTLVHKGNIMKYTEGAFRDWGYDVAKKEFECRVITEEEVGHLRSKAPATERRSSEPGNDKIVLKDRIADSMFQQILIRTEEYDVIALPNLNGDYLSDACVAQVGGLGMAPGANFGDFIALFEATHGTAPKYTGLNRANPSSLILSGVMMLEYLGWKEAAEGITRAMEKTIREGGVTQDLARMMVPPRAGLGTSEFADKFIENL